jgi:CDP-glucose 4,6-dehydratase
MEGMEMSFWQDRNVFLTGATGLLGSWMADELVSQGAHVICLVRDWVPETRLSPKVSSVRGELEDVQVLIRAINEYEINTVFHIGAQTIVGTSARSPLSTFEANIRGTYNLLEACRLNGQLVERVVVASSDKAYGEHETLPYTEDAPLQGRFPYDVSKSCADLICLSYYATYKLPVAITRCGNLYGGGDLNFNRLIPGTIRSILRNEAPVIRSDGQFIRDYFYVRDAVGAYLRLAEAMPADGISGEAFNFGTEVPLSVTDVVQNLLRVMGREDLKPVILNQASREIRRQYLDCTKARARLNWDSEHSLDASLEETIGWYRSHLG